jgi:beta-lactam-binding protein with PASTA domain/serine/threonine protein kinase
MATVYLALDTRLDREVAIKVMHAHLANDSQFTARFIREAKAAARLSHPNVVQVYDQGAEGDLLYLAMEHLRGRTLREVLAERGVLTPREALTVLDPLLDALSAAHHLGIIHRDIKPENVILTDDGRVKVADFGLARVTTTGTSTTGVLLGTVAYLSPELVVHGVADARSDVYAAGIMLFEMLTGQLPFSGGAPIQVAYQHVNDQVPAPSTVVPHLDPRLDDLVAASTARDPDERPADAGELLVRARTVQAELTLQQLDARPTPPQTSQDDVTTSHATEVFGAPGAPQHTRALPGLGLGTSPDQMSGPALPIGPSDRDLVTEVTPSDAEDAALAALLRRRRVIGMSALLTVLALALALAGTAWYFAIGPGAYTPTPSVAGLTVTVASEQLKAKGLRSTQVDVFDGAAAGIVVSTKPGAGRPVRKDGTVQLHVSRGPEFVTVPPVVGRTESEAHEALATAHLSVGQTQQQFSDRPPGEVLTVDPEVGRQTRNGTAVTLTLSKGPQPVDVPSVVGASRIEAELKLRASRLGVTYGPPVFDETVPEGFVISQTPADGTLLPGEKVTLVLSKGPPLVAVPDVVGKQYVEARIILRAAGFNVRRTDVLGGIFGTVRMQAPGAGTKAPKNSTIVLTIV